MTLLSISSASSVLLSLISVIDALMKGSGFLTFVMSIFVIIRERRACRPAP